MDGTPETILERNCGLPSQLLQDELIVAVPASDALWPGDMLDGQALALDALDHLHHIVHGNHLRAAQVERLTEVRLGDAQDPLHTVINEGEATGLLAIAPHLDLLGRCQHLDGDYCQVGLAILEWNH